MTHPRDDVKHPAPHGLLASIVGPWRISTVDMGSIALPAGFRSMPNILGYRFETMVFRGNESSDLDMVRANTEAGAREAHEAMCAKWAEVAEDAL